MPRLDPLVSQLLEKKGISLGNAQAPPDKIRLWLIGGE
jgi:hypothetical protein